MTLLYVLSGGQLRINSIVFASEMLIPDSSLRKIVKAANRGNDIQPKITKFEDVVTVDFNDASDIQLDENFIELFKNLKTKYKDRIKGSVVIRITALTTYHMVLDLNSDDDGINY